MRVLVTGSTGNVGREVVHALLEREAGVVAAGRNLEEVVERFGGSVTPARLDLHDRASHREYTKLRTTELAEWRQVRRIAERLHWDDITEPTQRPGPYPNTR